MNSNNENDNKGLALSDRAKNIKEKTESPKQVRVLFISLIIVATASSLYQFSKDMSWLELLQSNTVFSWIVCELESLSFEITVGWGIYMKYRVKSLYKHNKNKKAVIFATFILWLNIGFYIFLLMTFSKNLQIYTWIMIAAVISVIPWLNYETNYILYKRRLAKVQGE